MLCDRCDVVILISQPRSAPDNNKKMQKNFKWLVMSNRKKNYTESNSTQYAHYCAITNTLGNEHEDESDCESARVKIICK